MFHLLLRTKGEHHLGGVFYRGAAEEARQQTVLCVEVVEHDTQLFAVFRHEVRLTARELVSTVAYVVDFLCNESRHGGQIAR